MKYATLGNSGLVVSRLTLGAMTFGAGDYFGLRFTVDQKGADEMIGRAMDAGVNLIDTADMYCNGVSEEMVGKALGAKRKDVIIATKSAFRAGPQAFNSGIGFKHIVEAAEGSLRRLKTDCIDVYLMHVDDPITPVEESLRAMEYLVQRGHIRYAGFSNFRTWKAATALQMQKDSRYAPFVTSQMHYSLLNRDIEHEFVPFLEATGVGLMVWSPLSSGFLSGKYTKTDPKPEDSRLNTFDIMQVDRELGYRVVDVLKRVAGSHGASPAQIAIAWLLAKPFVSTVILGASRLSQLEDNLKAADIELTVSEIKELDDLTAPRMLYPNVFYGMADPVLREAGRCP